MPFQRLGDSAQGEGVGLGLAVAKGFVEAMGGEIEVEDTPGRRAHDRAPAARPATMTPHPRRRRRAAAPAGARHEPEGARVRRRSRADRRGGPRARGAQASRPRRARPRAARDRRRRGDPRASAAGHPCRSSCSRFARPSGEGRRARRRRRRLRDEAVRDGRAPRPTARGAPTSGAGRGGGRRRDRALHRRPRGEARHDVGTARSG